MNITSFILCIIGLLFQVANLIILINYLLRRKAILKTQEEKSAFLSLRICIFFFVLGIITFGYEAFAQINNKLEVPVHEAVLVAVTGLASAIVVITIIRLLNSIQRERDNYEDMREVRNKMLANLSHEIRTPMNVIMGLTEVMQRKEGMDEKDKENLSNISTAGSSLLTIVNDVIDFSKIESNNLEIIENEYETGIMLDDVINRANYLLKDSQVELLADIDETIPKKLFGDDVRLRQVLTNLLSNACKFTAEGVVTLHATWESIDNDNAMLKFSVEDTGIGISNDNAEKIFNSYGRNDNSYQHRKGGIGLGLPLAKTIIEKMHGEISFVSEAGVGTTFYVNVAQRIVDLNPVGNYVSARNAQNRRFTFTAPTTKVLVVDDNIVNLFVAKELLAEYDIEVQTADSGENAVFMVQEAFYDLIFMDYLMPEMDGVEAMHAIRSLPSDYFKSVPIVALTANASIGADKFFEEEGFAGYLTKPINTASLEDLLLKLLPSEYICKVEKDQELDVVPIETTPWFKRFSSILTDVDVKKGLSYSNNDYTTYLNLLRVIFNDGKETIATIRKCMADENMKLYTTTVHALKSVSESAGNGKLSYFAREHENAGKKNDAMYLRNNVDALISEYESFLRKIDILLQREAEVMGRCFSEQRESRSREEIYAMVDKLHAFLDDYDVDNSEDILHELEKTELSSSEEKAVEDAINLLRLFKYEEADQVITEGFSRNDTNYAINIDL